MTQYRNGIKATADVVNDFKNKKTRQPKLSGYY